MTIGKGNVSHNAVLADLDLGVGSLRQRAVYNRVGKTGGNMSLSEHRGVACSPQLIIDGGWNNPPTKRDRGYARYFPTEFGAPPEGNIATFDGAKVFLSINGGAPHGNATSEHITPFKITESGTYRITGSVAATENYTGYSGLSKWQWAIISSNSSYLAGNSTYDVVVQGSYLDGNGWNNKTFNETVSLSTSRPFGCLILYSISSAPTYTNASTKIATATFSNMRVIKA
jgi:hypothetical protein